MERQSGEKADHPMLYSLLSLGDGVMNPWKMVGVRIKAPGNPDQFSLFHHPLDGFSIHTVVGNFLSSQEGLVLQKSVDFLSLSLHVTKCAY